MQRISYFAALGMFTTATIFAQQPAPVGNRVPATGPAATQVTDAARAAADEIGQYVNQHMDELKPKLAAMGVQRPSTPADLDRLKSLLPADLAPKLDLARPALLEMAAKGRSSMIVLNLKFVGNMMAGISINPDEPEREVKPVSTLGELVMRAEDVHYFVAPETAVPENILKGTRAQQAGWVNANSIFKLLAVGRAFGSSGPDAIIAVERTDLEPAKPELAVLMGDGRVEMLDRAKVEAAIKQK
jgi:hypothetical protein